MFGNLGWAQGPWAKFAGVEDQGKKIIPIKPPRRRVNLLNWAKQLPWEKDTSWETQIFNPGFVRTRSLQRFCRLPHLDALPVFGEIEDSDTLKF